MLKAACFTISSLFYPIRVLKLYIIAHPNVFEGVTLRMFENSVPITIKLIKLGVDEMLPLSHTYMEAAYIEKAIQ